MNFTCTIDVIILLLAYEHCLWDGLGIFVCVKVGMLTFSIACWILFVVFGLTTAFFLLCLFHCNPKITFVFNHSSGYFPILLAMYCRTTYNDASAWLINVYQIICHQNNQHFKYSLIIRYYKACWKVYKIMRPLSHGGMWILFWKISSNKMKTVGSNISN